MRNVSDRSCGGNQNTHFVVSDSLLPENRTIYETMWKNVVDPDRPHTTVCIIRPMHISCRKA